MRRLVYFPSSRGSNWEVSLFNILSPGTWCPFCVPLRELWRPLSPRGTPGHPPHPLKPSQRVAVDQECFSHPLGLQSYLRFEGGTGVGLEGPVIPSEEVLGALGRVFFAS